MFPARHLVFRMFAHLQQPLASDIRDPSVELKKKSSGLGVHLCYDLCRRGSELKPQRGSHFGGTSSEMSCLGEVRGCAKCRHSDNELRPRLGLCNGQRHTFAAGHTIQFNNPPSLPSLNPLLLVLGCFCTVSATSNPRTMETLFLGP